MFEHLRDHQLQLERLHDEYVVFARTFQTAALVHGPYTALERLAYIYAAHRFMDGAALLKEPILYVDKTAAYIEEHFVN